MLKRFPAGTHDRRGGYVHHSLYQAQADLDANANATLIQSIKLENEGWERDIEVAEPSEPTFTEPA